ncbi:MAG: hypothetical protein HYS98_01175 [Deltaproteobacteria bacterium]|nr:hypothetical protein [Deltaproteobacteria bacterium]
MFAFIVCAPLACDKGLKPKNQNTEPKKEEKYRSLETLGMTEPKLAASISSEFLPYSEFLTYIQSHQKNLTREKNEDKRKVKINFLKEIQEALNNLPEPEENDVNVSFEEKLFKAEISDTFKGRAQEAIQLYAQISTGRHPRNLFVESGAGLRSYVTDLLKINNGYEFTLEKHFKSDHAYHTKDRVRLLFYKKNNTYISLNQHVRDFGDALRIQKVEKEGKTYHPIHYEITIDVYHQLGNDTFQFLSWNLFDGQTQESRHGAINAAKKVGDFVSFGLLGRGIAKIVQDEAEEVWSKRRALFQELLKK